jgi:tetratricopeptide (TPR) repeat protein
MYQVHLIFFRQASLSPTDFFEPIFRHKMIRALLFAALMSLPMAVDAQGTDHVVAGDRAYVALDATGALAEYESAIAADPGNYEALWKASRSAIDLGSYSADKSRRASLFSRGEEYARRSVALEPGDAEGHFALARALGKTALTQSPRGRIRYATDIRAAALECLRLNPRHAGCLHVMGMWNAEVMRLNTFTRLIAKNVLGGRVFGMASWKEAVRNMEASVASDPERIVHRLDLAEVYRDVGEKAKATAELEAVMRLPATDFNDGVYKSQAKAALSSR